MKTKKTPKIEYGIEITKPHSQEMYDHNDKVSKLMKSYIKSELIFAYRKSIGEIAHDGGMIAGEEQLRTISKYICFSGFGHGYELEDIYNETSKDLECMPNWQLDQEYDDMVNEGLVEQVFDEEGRKIGLVGFNTYK